MHSFRASCDRCYRAKVRCGFDGQSSCVRCLSQKQQCRRSTTKKLGRKPKKKGQSISIDGNAFRRTATELSNTITLAGEAVTNWDLDIYSLLESKYSTSETDSIPIPIWSVNDGYSTAPSASTGARQKLATIQSPEAIRLCHCGQSITVNLTELQRASAENFALDQILRYNKSSIATIRSVLACEIDHDESFALLVILLLQNILTCYRKAWCARWGSIDAQQKSTQPSDVVNSRVRQIQFGEYIVDEEDGDSLRKQILLLDLQKLIPMLEQVIDWIKKDNNGCCFIYDFLKDFLATETQILMKRLMR